MRCKTGVGFLEKKGAESGENRNFGKEQLELLDRPDLERGLAHQLVERHNAEDGRLTDARLHVVVGLEQAGHDVSQVLTHAPRGLLLNHLGQHLDGRLKNNQSPFTRVYATTHRGIPL